MNQTLFRSTVLSTALLCGIAAAGTGAAAGGQHGKKMIRELQGKTGARFDQAFLKSMTQHHEMGLHMNKAYLESNGSDDVKDLAKKIGNRFEEGIASMRKMTEAALAGAGIKEDEGKARGGSDAGMTERHAAKFRASKNPDRDYLEMMKAHHVAGLDMGALAVQNAQSEDLRQAASEMVDKEAEEILEIRKHLDKIRGGSAEAAAAREGTSMKAGAKRSEAAVRSSDNAAGNAAGTPSGGAAGSATLRGNTSGSTGVSASGSAGATVGGSDGSAGAKSTGTHGGTHPEAAAPKTGTSGTGAGSAGSNNGAASGSSKPGPVSGNSGAGSPTNR